MKIHIIGGPGSGKTFLAEKLSKELGISHFDLDDLQWDNKSASYGVKRSPDERDRLLNNVLSHNDWIIEGVYYAWCQQCFADADRIYVLNVPRYKYRYRIIRRFVRRKLGLEKGKKENLKSLRELLKWADNYQKANLVEIRKLLIPYSDKVIE
jgi:adenylate kinase family enzyme